MKIVIFLLFITPFIALWQNKEAVSALAENIVVSEQEACDWLLNHGEIKTYIEKCVEKDLPK